MIYLKLLIYLVQAFSLEVSQNGKCYQFRLVGSMIDSNRCETTNIDIKEIDCTSKENIQAFKKNAVLSSCDENKAFANILIDENVFDFEIRKEKMSSGLVKWMIHDPSTDIVVKNKNKTKKDSIEKDKTTEKVEIIKEVAKFKITLYLDGSYVYNSNTPSKFDGSSFEKNNGLMSNAKNHNNINLDLLNITFNYKYKKGNIFFSLMKGDNYQSFIAKQDGSDNQVNNLSEFGIIYKSSSKASYKAGRFLHPVQEKSSALHRDTYSFSLLESIATPNYIQGIGYIKESSDKLMYELYLINGWNAFDDDRAGIGFYAGTKYKINEKGSLYLSYLSSSENVAGQSTTKNSFLLKTNYNLSKKIKLGFDYTMGESNKETSLGGGGGLSWSSMLFKVMYQYTNKKSFAFHIEQYSQDSGYLDLDLEDVTSYLFTYKNRVYNNLSLFSELKYDMSNDNFFAQDGDKITDTQILALVGMSLGI